MATSGEFQRTFREVKDDLKNLISAIEDINDGLNKLFDAAEKDEE